LRHAGTPSHDGGLLRGRINRSSEEKARPLPLALHSADIPPDCVECTFAGGYANNPTYLGIAIFIGLTAWDTQQIKQLIQQAQDDTTARRVAIIGALKLYLDFINLFVLLLRVFGSRDE
jgi:hypothetical protein